VPIDGGGSGEWVKVTISTADGNELVSAGTRIR